jgi:hypothetical protein
MNIQLTTPWNEFWSFIGRFGDKWSIVVASTAHNPLRYWANADEEHRVNIVPTEKQCQKITAALADGRISIATLEALENEEYERTKFRALIIPGEEK